MPMTIEDFDKDPRWQAFAEEYIKNGGVMTHACTEAGFAVDTAAKIKKQNPVFVEWLAEVVDRKMSSAINKGDIRLAQKVEVGKPMDSAMRGTQKLLYERKDKLGAKLQINNNTTINQGDPLSMEIIDELIDWKVAQKMRENALAGRN